MYLKIEQSHLAQIGIKNCKMNLEEPTLIYVCACCRSKNPNKSPNRKDFTRTFLICSFLKNRCHFLIISCELISTFWRLAKHSSRFILQFFIPIGARCDIDINEVGLVSKLTKYKSCTFHYIMFYVI